MKGTEVEKLENEIKSLKADLQRAVKVLEKPWICAYCKERESEKFGKSCKGQENSCCSFRIDLSQTLITLKTKLGGG